MPERKIIISTEKLRMEAILTEGSSADMFWNALPLTGRANTWGDEIYFNVNLQMQLDSNASDIVESGNIAFWPPGSAFCIFFGRTPASLGDEVRAASAVNVLGKIDGDERDFRSVPSGEEVRLEKL
ncbi:MAG: cyclophilin-like fold protein [Chloroflexota bacterium]|nr:cyclophilin-like fold protein [Chloroflexota bacterium]